MTELHMSIPEVLNEIWELGYINMKTKQIIYPKFSVHMKGRIEPFIKFLMDYFQKHPDEEKYEFFYTLYDGFREHSEPSQSPTFIPATKELLQDYKGIGSAGEPGRFFHPFHKKDIFPYFQIPVINWCKHINDPYTLLIPDYEMIGHNYVSIKDDIDKHDISWESKIPKVFWRSSLHGIGYHAYDTKSVPGIIPPRSQRRILVEESLREQQQGHNWLDAKPSRTTTKQEILQYKYLISCDGEVVNYSSNVWTMYSNSVVFRIQSHYIQWYFKDLQEWVHYIPIKADLTDLKEKYEWAISHDDECKKIAENGREFMKQLTYDSLLENYKLE
jgi:hypothetical protein